MQATQEMRVCKTETIEPSTVHSTMQGKVGVDITVGVIDNQTVACRFAHFVRQTCHRTGRSSWYEKRKKIIELMIVC